MTLETADHERVVFHRTWLLEQLVQFGIVLLDGALESRPDEGVLGIVASPPGAFELEHRLVPFADHADSLAVGVGPIQAPSRKVAAVAEELDRPYLIGVAGGSSSGKSTIADRLADLIGEEHLSLIRLDSYYVVGTDQPLEVRAAADYDHPDAFDWPLLNDHLAALTAGASVPVPVYDFANYDRSDEVRLVQPARVIVVEGILVLWEPTLRDRFDLKIFIDTPADLRLIRRLQRDVAERGRTPESVIDQYLTTVRPSHERFVEPSKRYADVIVPEGGLNRPAIEVLLARVREVAGSTEANGRSLVSDPTD